MLIVEVVRRWLGSRGGESAAEQPRVGDDPAGWPWDPALIRRWQADRREWLDQQQARHRRSKTGVHRPHRRHRKGKP